jgi:hypothetical protein
MNKDDLNQLVTKKDLEELKFELCKILSPLIKPVEEFYSVKEFAQKTGQKAGSVSHQCRTGKIKATQRAPNCAWLIYQSELEGLIKSANDDYTR